MELWYMGEQGTSSFFSPRCHPLELNICEKKKMREELQREKGGLKTMPLTMYSAPKPLNGPKFEF